MELSNQGNENTLVCLVNYDNKQQWKCDQTWNLLITFEESTGKPKLSNKFGNFCHQQNISLPSSNCWLYYLHIHISKCLYFFACFEISHIFPFFSLYFGILKIFLFWILPSINVHFRPNQGPCRPWSILQNFLSWAYCN